jgi:hypothetical protein
LMQCVCAYPHVEVVRDDFIGSRGVCLSEWILKLMIKFR